NAPVQPDDDPDWDTWNPWLAMIGLGLGFTVFVRNLFRLRKLVEEVALAAPRQEDDQAAWMAPDDDDDEPTWMTLGNDDD
ncbi:MAG: hypothetical protein GY946_13280, partial [bacterium]|nr:hypothetical protein [bacterium]